MRETLQSLSVISGAVVVAAVCEFVAYLTGRASNLKAGAVAGVLVSGVLSYTLYWAPMWFGSGVAQYASWAMLVVGVWFISGVLGVLGACLLLAWRRARLRTSARGAHV